MTAPIAVDPEQLASFVAAMFRHAGAGGWISLRAFRDDADNLPPFDIKAVPMNGDLSKISKAAAGMARRCAANREPVVFCPPIATFSNPKKADEGSLDEGLALSLELDDDPARGRKRLEFLFGIPPTVVVASGGTWIDPKTGEQQPKLHCHWRLTEPTRDREAHRRLKQARAMATALVGGDASNKPVVHPIRWPGSVHRKGEPKLCRIVEINPDAEIDLQAALNILLDVQPEFRGGKAGAVGKMPGEGEDRATPELIRALLAGEDFHATLLALAMRYLKAGMAPGQVIAALSGMMQAVPPELRDSATPGRWQARYDDIPRMVRQGQEKLGGEGESAIDLDQLVERAGEDPGAAFEPAPLEFLAAMRARDPAAYERARGRLRKAKVRIGALDQEVERRTPEGNDRGPQGRALVFPEIEPWPEPVEGAELLDAMTAHLQRFAVMPSSHATTAICLFALHCHAIDAATHTPRLLITSPTRECGKSQVMEWLAGVVPRPFDVIDPTGPTLFRPIEAHQPTVLIDEGDLVSWDERRDVRMVINAGHNRFSPGVPRCVGEDNEPRMFRVWAPLAYAMIGKPLDTQLSRSIVIPMRRMAPDQRAEYRRIDRDQGFSELQRKCTRWAADHIDALRASDPELPLTGRKANCWRPLCAIADAASGNWPDKARAAAKALSDIDADAEAIGVQLLADMQIVFDTTKAEAIWTEDLLRHLHDMSERPWCEYGRQRKPITPRQMAGLLKPFGIVAGQVWKEETNKRGYTSEQFSSVWARYLSASPLEATESASFSDFPSARDDQPLADGNPPKTTESASSSTLADRNPLCAEVGPICAHCGRLIDASDGYTAASSGEVLHNACVDAWLKDTR